MNPTRKQQTQTQDTQPTTEQQSQSHEEKQLTLEELASVTGGRAPLQAVKVEDSGGNKGEAG